MSFGYHHQYVSLCYNTGSPLSSPTSLNYDIKPKRPFKALSKKSLELAVNLGTNEHLFAQYRQQYLNQMEPKENRELQKNMRRIFKTKTDDPEYLKKRKRNNEAAKRSREQRKAKKKELAIRLTFLEQEAILLKVKLEQSLRERDLLLESMFPCRIYY